MERRRRRRSLMFCLAAGFAAGLAVHVQTAFGVQNVSGMRLIVANDNTCPTLHIILPGRTDTDRAIEVLFPEHVTVRKQGETEGSISICFGLVCTETCLIGGRSANPWSTKRISKVALRWWRAPRSKTMECVFGTNS